MTRWTMSAIACAVSMVFAAPLWAQTPSTANQSGSPATTSAAPATPPSSACAGLTGTAREDCLSHENASHALCFGMNEKVRADCVKSYYPNDQQAQPARPTTGQSSSTTTEAPASAGMSGNADRGVSGSTATGGGTGGRAIQN